MQKPNQSPAALASRIRRNYLGKNVSPALRKEAARVTKNLDALARHKAKKAEQGR